MEATSVKLVYVLFCQQEVPNQMLLFCYSATGSCPALLCFWTYCPAIFPTPAWMTWFPSSFLSHCSPLWDNCLLLFKCCGAEHGGWEQEGFSCWASSVAYQVLVWWRESSKGSSCRKKIKELEQREGSEESNDRGSSYFILEQNVEDKNLTTEGEAFSTHKVF